MVDGGYFWHYNELWLGGSGAPGEKAWEIALIPSCSARVWRPPSGFSK